MEKRIKAQEPYEQHGNLCVESVKMTRVKQRSARAYRELEQSLGQHPHDIARGIDHVHRVANGGCDVLLGHEHHQTREEDLRGKVSLPAST